MPSIIPGYEYDIFISYRHKDNKGGHWVTEFVEALQTELDATFKEDISIYFDENPHDGLLETHHVDKSVEGKLKCLIFIPIISQTYCDPKSFAWEQEFCAFNKLAKVDVVGRDIKLNNGNVASRILPVKIHDLDTNDKSTIESEIGGVLRSIDFIFKSTGVNRPLRSQEDHPHDNLNKTYYRDQINKVANAVKEIVTAIKAPNAPSGQTTTQLQPKAKVNRKPLVTILVLILIVVLAAYFFYNEESPEKTVAVLPFIDLSDSTDQGIFSDGLTDEIINSLVHVKDLSVISRTSSFAFKGKSLQIQIIADSLKVNYIVEGTIRKSGKSFRITAQLIRAKDGFHVWSITYERKAVDIFDLQQEIAIKIAEGLDISLDPKTVEKMQWVGTKNPQAYEAFRKGRKLFTEGHFGLSEVRPYLEKAKIFFDEAIRFDPYFAKSYVYKSDFYLHAITDEVQTIPSDTLTKAQNYKLLIECIENAIARSKSEIEKDYYTLHLIYLSNDWSNVRSIAERVLKSPEAVNLFSFNVFGINRWLSCIGYDKQMTAIYKATLKRDPFNRGLKVEIINNTIFAGNYSRAIDMIDSLNAIKEDNRLYYRKIFCMYKLKKFDEAYSHLMQFDSSTVINYNSLVAMLLAKKGKIFEAKQIMDKPGAYYTLFGVEAAYGRDSVNRKVNELDKKLAGDQILLTYMFSPKNLPFDLSATPNFVKRFRTAGVIIE